MKINQISIIFIMNLLYHHNMLSFFNDEFENNFIDQIHAIEKSMQESFHRFHNQLLQDYEIKKPTLTNGTYRNIPTQALQQKNNFYQQSSRSLSFSNQEKAITITEQKDQLHEFYTIEITDKSSNAGTTRNEKNNPTEELRELQTYIKKNFIAVTAEKIIENCIKTIEQEDKDKFVNIEISQQDHHKKYIIEIIYEQKNQNDTENTQNNNEDIEIEEDQDTRRKKKKSHHYKPTSKQKK